MAFCTKCGREIPQGGICQFCASSPPPQDARGFFASLFDFTLAETITPLIIRILYVIGIIVIALGVFIALIAVINTAQYRGGESVALSLIGIPVGAFIALISLRLYLEFIMVFFNIYSRLKEMQDMIKARQQDDGNIV